MKELQRTKNKEKTEKMTIVASLTHVLGRRRPHTAHPIALKISHWFYWSVSLAYQVFIFWKKVS